MKFFSVSKAVLFLSLASLFNDIASDSIYSIFPLYLSSLGASVLFLGIFEGIAESVASLTKFGAGYASDHVRDQKKIVFAGYALSSVAKPVLALVTLPWHALICRFFDRVGKGIRSAPRDAWLAANANENNRGKIFGFHRTMDHIGAFAGPLLAALFLYFYPGEYRWLFALTIIPGLLVLLFVVLAPKDKKHVPRDGGISFSGMWRESKNLNPHLKKYLAILLLFTLGNSSDAFLILKLKSTGLSDAMIPLLWALLHVVKLSFATIGGSFSDSAGRKPSILLGWGIFVLSYAGFAFLTHSYAVIAVFLFYGLFYSFTEAAEKAFIADISRREEWGSAYGAFNLILGIGALPASVLTGYLWQSFGPTTAFSTGAIFTGIAAILLLLLKVAAPAPGNASRSL